MAYGQDGIEDQIRLERTLGQVVQDAHGHFHEAARQGNVFSLTLAATTTGVAAGNIVGAAAAASTQFAIWNPSNSSKVLSILKFGMGVISGTPGAGPMFHSLLVSAPTVANAGGPPLSNYGGIAANSVAGYVASAGGAALTGGPALKTLRVADFSSTATAQASVGELKAIELIDGEIVLPPGSGWVPCWGAAGTSLLNGYSVTWEELPI